MLQFWCLTFLTTLAQAMGHETNNDTAETPTAAFVQRVLRGSIDSSFRRLQLDETCTEDGFVGCDNGDLMTGSCGTFFQEASGTWCFDSSIDERVCCGSKEYCCEPKIGLMASVIGGGALVFLSVFIVLSGWWCGWCHRREDKLSSPPMVVYSSQASQNNQRSAKSAIQTRSVEDHPNQGAGDVSGQTKPRNPSKLLSVLQSFANELQNVGNSVVDAPSRPSTPTTDSSVSSFPMPLPSFGPPNPVSIEDDQLSSPAPPTSRNYVVCKVCQGNGKMNSAGEPDKSGSQRCKLCNSRGVVALENEARLESCVSCQGMGAFDKYHKPTSAYGSRVQETCNDCKGRCFFIVLKGKRVKTYSMVHVQCKACQGMGKFDATWANPTSNGQVNCVPCGATGMVSIKEGESLEKCTKCKGKGGRDQNGAPTKYHYGYKYDHAWYTAPCWGCNGRCYAVGSSSPQCFPAANVECPLCKRAENRKGCPSCGDAREVCLKYGERLSVCILCKGKGAFGKRGDPIVYFSRQKREDCNGCQGLGYEKVSGSTVEYESDSG